MFLPAAAFWRRCLACFSGAAAAGPGGRWTVNVYTYRQPALINPLLEAFTAKTGIQVRAVFADNGLVERLARRAATARPTCC